MTFRTSRLFVAIFAVAVLAGCNRHPHLTPDQIVAQLPGKRVPLEGPLAPVWTFGARSPTRVTILENEYEGKTSSLIVEVRSQSTPGTEPIIRARGRLRLGFEWIAGEWSLLHVDNLTFQQVPTTCARFLPNEVTTARAQDLPSEVLAGAVIPSVHDASLAYEIAGRDEDSHELVVNGCRGLQAIAMRGGHAEVVSRVLLPDGRLAVAVATNSFNETTGSGRGGFLAILTLDDRIVVADAIGLWGAESMEPLRLRVEHLGGQAVYVETSTITVAGLPTVHQERIRLEQEGNLRTLGNVPLDGQVDHSCDPGGGPWKRRFVGRSTFAGNTVSVRDDVTWERGSCADGALRLDPVRRSLTRTFQLRGDQLAVSPAAADEAPSTPR